MTPDDFKPHLAAEYHKYIATTGQPEGRLMVAQGLVPVPPKEQLTIFCALSYDVEEAVAVAAKTSLLKMPSGLVNSLAEQSLSLPVFDTLLNIFKGKDETLVVLVANRDMPNDVLLKYLDAFSGDILDVVCNDLQRCLNSKDLVLGLRAASELRKASFDRMVETLVRSGIIYEELSECASVLGKLSATELDAAIETIPISEDCFDCLEQGDGDTPSVAIGEDAEKDSLRIPMMKRIATLSVAQKIALAVRGNREARTILIRDSNRVISVAVIKNPRITEPEVVSAVKNHSLSGEIIRLIAMNKELTRSYQVKLALVYNPKTPTQTAMKFIGLLREADIRKISTSRGVPDPVSAQARRLVAKKKDKR